MSEFKFACPVCGQHITADSRTSGTQLDCPTCFQKLIIPQAPASGNSKLIISAVQVGKARSNQTENWQDAKPVVSRRASLVSLVVWVLVLGVALGAGIKFRRKIVSFVRTHLHGGGSSKEAVKIAGDKFHPVPTNISWTMDLSKAKIPDGPVSGGIRGTGFICEKATLQGGNLTLRQGRSWPPDLGVTVHLFAKQGEELSGKTVEVGPDRSPPLPKIVLRWKDDQDQARKQDFVSGYALKMIFGEAVDARMPGKIFLSLPDEGKTFVSGTFEAEIHKPPPPKPR